MPDFDPGISRRSVMTGLAGAACSACQTSTPEMALQWREARPMPYAVQEIYPTLHRGEIWVAGGFSPQSGGATERVIAFNPAHGAWREAPSLPTPSHHVQLASLNDELYAIGGFIGGDTRTRWICTARVLKLINQAWVESDPLPIPMAESISIVHQDQIHIVGGRTPRGGSGNSYYGDHIDTANHFSFRVGEGWRPAAPSPLARNSAAAASTGAELHVISGRTIAGEAVDSHDIYDFRADRWRAGQTFPEPRGGLAATYWRGRICAGGGERFQDRSVGATLYAFENGEWTELSTLPTARHGFGLIAGGRACYALGGSHEIATGAPLASVDVLR